MTQAWHNDRDIRQLVETFYLNNARVHRGLADARRTHDTIINKIRDYWKQHGSRMKVRLLNLV